MVYNIVQESIQYINTEFRWIILALEWNMIVLFIIINHCWNFRFLGFLLIYFKWYECIFLFSLRIQTETLQWGHVHSEAHAIYKHAAWHVFEVGLHINVPWIRINTCTQIHQSNVSACVWATCEAVNMISNAYFNKTHNLKTRHIVNGDK